MCLCVCVHGETVKRGGEIKSVLLLLLERRKSWVGQRMPILGERKTQRGGCLQKHKNIVCKAS